MPALWPEFRMTKADVFGRVARRDGAARGTVPSVQRLGDVMTTNHRLFGLIVGGIVVVTAAVFIFGGGDWGGKKTVDSDRDLPPLASTDR